MIETAMIASDLKTNPRAVIVGGSFAGLAVGRHLRNHSVHSKPIDVIVIEPKDFFE
jgi:cation diffusion facilitator CzcD-associated flavoprotein CzcO